MAEYIYIRTTALYYWPNTTGMTHLKIRSKRVTLYTHYSFVSRVYILLNYTLRKGQEEVDNWVGTWSYHGLLRLLRHVTSQQISVYVK